MSGGELDYLSSRAGRPDEYAVAAERLLGYGHSDAAAAVQAVADALAAAQFEAESLESVLHALEWCLSGDTCEDDLRREIELWRDGRGDLMRGQNQHRYYYDTARSCLECGKPGDAVSWQLDAAHASQVARERYELHLRRCRREMAESAKTPVFLGV